MNVVYRAVLHGDRLEWIDHPPPRMNPMNVRITVPEEEESAEQRRERGRGMAAALRSLAARRGAFSRIEDPFAWQREIREDRIFDERD